jgi:2-iminobutanoate/2-iminopropanoate deaminase
MHPLEQGRQGRVTKSAVSAADAPKAIGPYSHAIRAGELLFVSGQVAIDPATGNLIDGDITAQTRRVMDNLAAVLKAGGLSLQHVVRTTIFLADMSDFVAVNTVYGSFFSEPYPARATVQVSRLPKDARVEIDAIASYS